MQLNSLYVFDITKTIDIIKFVEGGYRMAEIRDVYGSIYQNLIDAGCNQQIIDQCMAFIKEEKYLNMLDMLCEQRKSLLSAVHTGQKRIDCLDFLTHKIEKEFMSGEVQ